MRRRGHQKPETKQQHPLQRSALRKGQAIVRNVNAVRSNPTRRIPATNLREMYRYLVTSCQNEPPSKRSERVADDVAVARLCSQARMAWRPTPSTRGLRHWLLISSDRECKFLVNCDKQPPQFGQSNRQTHGEKSEINARTSVRQLSIFDSLTFRRICRRSPISR